MVVHVLRRGVESGAQSVCVAADDERIVAAVRAAGGRAHMTSPDHHSGTDRIAEVARLEKWSDDTIVVNLQGDEPCMAPAALSEVAGLLASADADLATLATPIRSPDALFSSDVVKVVIDDAGFARWFSRAPIPWVRGAFETRAPDGGTPAGAVRGALRQEGAKGHVAAELPGGIPFLRHLGIYAYRVGVLHRVCAAEPHVHERAESLEQLRALAIGMRIRVGVVESSPGHGVDTEADLERAEALLQQRR